MDPAPFVATVTGLVYDERMMEHQNMWDRWDVAQNVHCLRVPMTESTTCFVSVENLQNRQCIKYFCTACNNVLIECTCTYKLTLIPLAEIILNSLRESSKSSPNISSWDWLIDANG